jgi:predicted acylesterase/phospholipase RssA
MAMNGGVSLAVWMGGCAVELDCARRAHWGEDQSPDPAKRGGATRTVYSALCKAFRRELVIDIMSGASAGGVNGGLLAAASFFRRRLDPAYVRKRWLELGDFAELLHPSTDPAPRSLLQGQHFVDSLREVFGDLAADEAHATSLGLAIPGSQSKEARSSTPNLDVTVTDVRGTERTYRDKWQEIFAAREYRRRFSFRHKADFTPENLAEAARCSASFPAAFEPYRPNARSWSLTNRPGLESLGEGPPWTIDGGLLDNAPIRAAIDLIPTRPASRQVKRFLVYVNPESQGQLVPRGGGVGTNADGRTLSDEPDLAKVAGYVVNLPRKLPFVDQLDAIGDAVQKSSRVADGVLDLLAAPIETLDDAAKTLFPAYTSRRRLKSLRELLRDPAAAERAYDDLKATGVELPWIPKTLELGDPPRWDWGQSTAIRVCHFLLDLIRLAIAQHPDRREELLGARVRLDQPLTELQTAYAGTQNDEELIGELVAPDPTLSQENRVAGVRGLASDSQGGLEAVRTAVCIFADLLDALGGELILEREAGGPVEVGAAVLGGGWRTDGDFREARKREPRKRARALSPPELQALQRLLSIEVIRRAFTAEELVDSSQELNFVQLTPDAPSPIFSSNPIDQPFAVSAETKLTGIRLGHFAGFLKRSWRANDFMWGRLDAAARIVDLLVDRARAGERGYEQVAAWLVRGVLGRDPTLEQRWLVAELLPVAAGDAAGGCGPPEAKELRPALYAALIADLSDPCKQAELTRAVCTRAAQLEIVRTELPAIAEATRQDAAEGSATKPIDFGQAETPSGELPAGVLRDAIGSVRVGEPLPVRLGRDDPAETTSDLTARMGARAGFVTLAALRTANLPAARALDFLRPLLLAVTGMSARGWLLRIPVVLGFWAASIYLAARVIDTSGSADLGALEFPEVLLALVAALSVIGVAVLPSVRGLRRRWQPVALAEFLAAFLILAAGGGAAIVGALGFGGLSPGQLIVANGFDPPPDWVLGPALAIILGLPLAAPALLTWAGNWVTDLSRQVAGAAVLLGLVSIVIGVWMGLDLTDAIGGGSWQTVASLIALIGPPLVATVYLLCHHARGMAPSSAER